MKNRLILYLFEIIMICYNIQITNDMLGKTIIKRKVNIKRKKEKKHIKIFSLLLNKYFLQGGLSINDRTALNERKY